MPPIPHIEDMDMELLLSALTTSQDLALYEKLDGMSFCLLGSKGKCFMRTRSCTFKSKQDISNVFFFDDLRRIADTAFLLDYHNEDWFAAGELIPRSDFNIIHYPAINHAVFIPFKISVSDRELSSTEAVSFCNTMNNQQATAKEKIVFYDKEQFRLIWTHAEIKDQLFFSIKMLTAALKQPKDRRHKFTTEIPLVAAKELILSKVKLGSFLNKEIEGLVLYSEGKPLCKLVDKNGFTAKKKENWRIIEGLKQAQTNMARKARKNPEKLAEHLSELGSYLDQQKFEPNMFSVPRKYFDTCAHYNMVANRLTAIETLLSQSSAKQVAELITERLI